MTPMESLPFATAYIRLTQKPEYLGWIFIQANGSANVRKKDAVESEVVHIVQEGTWYLVLSVSDNGWYEIQISENLTGFISPRLVSRIYFAKDDYDKRSVQAK